MCGGGRPACACVCASRCVIGAGRERMNGRVHGCLYSTRGGVCVTGWGWGILYAEQLSGFPGPGRRVRETLPADLRAASGGGGLCRMK